MATSRNCVNVGSPHHIEAIGPNGRQQIAKDRIETVATQSGGNLGPIDLMMVAMRVKPAPPQLEPMANYLANKKTRAKIRK